MPTQPALPIPPTTARRYRRSLLALTSLGAAGLLAGLLTGCSSATNPPEPAAAVTASISPALAGNWQFTSGPAVRLAGALAVTDNQVTGLLHPVSMSCASSTAAFAVHGTVSPEGKLTLASGATGFAGGALSISGAPAPDQHSLVDPVLTLTGGTCGAITTAPDTLRPADGVTTTGQQYQPITGSYSGTFTDTHGAAGAVDATLSQPTQPDTNGVYHLTGTATFANNPCLVSPVITDSTVTGNQISATYTDPNTHASITGTGTFSPDATTLTINNWVLTGDCDSDTGTGLLTRSTHP